LFVGQPRGKASIVKKKRGEKKNGSGVVRGVRCEKSSGKKR